MEVKDWILAMARGALRLASREGDANDPVDILTGYPGRLPGPERHSIF